MLALSVTDIIIKETITGRVGQVQGYTISCVIFAERPKEMFMYCGWNTGAEKRKLQLQHGLRHALLVPWIHGLVLVSQHDLGEQFFNID